MLFYNMMLARLVRMDSQIKMVEHLIAEGHSFNFNNFSQPHGSYPGQFAGSEKAEWVEWKTRVQRVVSKLMAQNSPAVELVNRGYLTKTRGNGINTFNTAKEAMLRALTNTLDALKEVFTVN